jgi:hypothetical protein
MRAISYVITLILVIVAPSLAGSADGDLPGAGTFSYSGTLVPPSAPQVVVALGQ